MGKAIKILEFENQFTAARLSEILTEKNIPHLLRTYHDTAYDGLWQSNSNWGHIEAPEEYSNEIKLIYANLLANG
jgi:hypothetical protein